MRKSRTTRIGMSHARHEAKRDAARRCDGKCMVRGNSDALPRREAGVQWTAMIKATVPDIFAPSMALALRARSLRSAFGPPLAFAFAILQTQLGVRRDDEQSKGTGFLVPPANSTVGPGMTRAVPLSRISEPGYAAALLRTRNCSTRRSSARVTSNA